MIPPPAPPIPLPLPPHPPWMGIPQVMIRAPPPPFAPPLMVAQGVPDAKTRQRLSYEQALIQRYGRNLVESGARSTPRAIVHPSHPVAPRPIEPPPASPADPEPARQQHIHPDEPIASAPIPPYPPTPPPDRNFLGTR